MAKKITITELVVKMSTDTKEAVKGLKQIEKLTQSQISKVQKVDKQAAKSKEREAVKQARNEEARIRHRERLQLNAQKAALQKEKLLLQDKLRNGQRVRRQEEANHRKAMREQQQQQRERASKRSKSSSGSGGASVGNIAIGSALGAGITSAVVAAIQAGFALFDSSKSLTMAKERITTNTYGRYRARGMSPEEAKANTTKDVAVISDLNKQFGYSFETTGGAFQATTSSGATREQATQLISTLLRELKSSGANEDAAFAFIREVKPLLAGGDISAQSSNQIEGWGLLPVLASMMGITEKALSKIAKDGKLATETGKLNIKTLQRNLDAKGVGKYIAEDSSMNPVTVAQQQLDAAMNRLKDTFAVHSSTGIAASLNSLAESLGNPSTQAMIIQAGENFGKLLVSASSSLNQFVEAGGLDKLAAMFSSENLTELSQNFSDFMRIMSAFSTVADVFVRLGDNIGRMAAELFGGYVQPEHQAYAEKVGKGSSFNTVTDPLENSTGYSVMKRETEKARVGKERSFKTATDPLEGSTRYSAMKREIDKVNSVTPTSVVQMQSSPLLTFARADMRSAPSSTSIDQSKRIFIHGDVTTTFVKDMESRDYAIFTGAQ